MAMDVRLGQWQVQPRENSIELMTNRIGMLVFKARAPVIGGHLSWTSAAAELEFQVDMRDIRTSNPILDLEVQALVTRGSNGVLTFAGKGKPNQAQVDLVGQAQAGNVIVPLDVNGQIGPIAGNGSSLALTGVATFADIHLPIPGMGHIHHLELKLEGQLSITLK